MLTRLQKFLSDAGIASRRKAEELILDGKITVNGRIVMELGTKVDDKNDIVEFNSKIVKKKTDFIYIMFHKPEGCVTTAKDQFNRKTVLDYVKEVEQRVYPVGRLDFDTSGLLILTNDGELTYRLTHPKYNVEKTYAARVKGTFSKKETARFENGIIIDGRKTAPAKVFIIKKDGLFTSLKIIIHEGRNRQVRKMCEAVGCHVVKLKRIAVGKLFLGELKKGTYRYLTDEEIRYLKSLHS